MNDELYSILRKEADKAGFELVDAVSAGDVIRVFIDKPGGILLGDCTRFSRNVYARFDAGDERFFEKYRLEVSSPGLDRPLRSSGDFRRHLEKKISVVYEYEGSLRSAEGFVISVDEDAVTVGIKNELLRIPLHDIKKAVLVLEW